MRRVVVRFIDMIVLLVHRTLEGKLRKNDHPSCTLHLSEKKIFTDSFIVDIEEVQRLVMNCVPPNF